MTIPFRHFDIHFESMCNLLLMTPDEMQSKRQGRTIAPARQKLMTLARTITDGSTVQIGKLFNRDHSTVIHASKGCDQNDEFKSLCDKATIILKSRPIMSLADYLVVRPPPPKPERPRKISLPSDQDQPCDQEAPAPTCVAGPQPIEIHRGKNIAIKMIMHSEGLSLNQIANLSNLTFAEVCDLQTEQLAKGNLCRNEVRR